MEMSKKNHLASSHQLFASFKLGKSELAVPISCLQEVVNKPDYISVVPLAPPYLKGLFNLRGTVIPVVDLSILLKLPSSPDENLKKIAIFICQDIRIGLLFDATSEILNVDENSISRFQSSEEERQLVLGALKLDDGRLVEIIDPTALIKIENIPHLMALSQNQQTEMIQKKIKRSKCITFLSQGVQLAFNIMAISEIIKIPEIQKTSAGADFGEGMVNLRGTFVPLLNFATFFKVSDTPFVQNEKSRIVIMKKDSMRFGFLVDSVDSILSYYEEDLLPIPLFQQQRIEAFKGLLCQEGKENILFLDENKVLNQDEIQRLQDNFNRIYQKNLKDADLGSSLRKSGVRKPYLCFKLEHMVSTPLKEVDEIAIPPASLMRPPGYPEYITGVLQMRGEVITVFDLRKFFGLEELKDTQHTRILIVKGVNCKMGFMVDSVESIENVDESQKIKIPMILAGGVNKALLGSIKEVLEMPNAKGEKKTFMLLDMASMIDSMQSLFSQPA